ncbi:MAG TPA: TetR/AcrR family transcriptional regulator [Methylophilaceae bacterium]|jgi:AcrR family transcriptional regulator
MHKNQSQQVTPQFGRAAILLTAVKLAALKGLTNMSLAELATEVGMSKSGLFAHFKTREELELATVETAIAILEKEVLQPAMQAPIGTARLRLLVNAFLSYLERKVFPRGCFIASAALELEAHPGPACDLVGGALMQWLALIKQCVEDGQAQGEIDPHADVAQAVFEIQAMMFSANYLFAVGSDTMHLAQSRTGVENILMKLAVNSDGNTYSK